MAAGLFKSVILDTHANEYHSTGSERKHYIERITALNNKITEARELLLNDAIDAADFKAVKAESEREITALEAKLSDLQTNKMSVAEVEKTLDTAIEKLTAIEAIYLKSDHYSKRKLIGSIYPEKFTIEDVDFLTAKRSDMFDLIYFINSKLHGNKNRTNESNSCLFRRMIQTRIEHSTLLINEFNSFKIPLVIFLKIILKFGYNIYSQGL